MRRSALFQCWPLDWLPKLAGVRSTRRTLAVAFMFCAMCDLRLTHAQVFLRGEREPIAGSIASVGVEGVRVMNAGADGRQSILIAWDDIRLVEGTKADAARAFEPLADRAWRARARLDRGDTAGAEALLEALAPDLVGTAGPTQARVFEGLLRCRLARGSSAAGVRAWLDALQARSDRSTETVWYQRLAPPTRPLASAAENVQSPIHSILGLCPALPPIVAKEPGLASSLAALESSAGAWSSQTPADLARLYEAAARFELGQSAGIVAVKSTSEGVRLVEDIVLARIADEVERARARDRLLGRLGTANIESWMEAWCCAGVGRSLIRESDADLKRRGIIQMLHIPARFPGVSTQLTGLMLAESATTAQSIGDSVTASILKQELARTLPSHSANQWPGVRDIPDGLAARSDRDPDREKELP